ncbi:hypothetical protein, partial [Lentibacillus populi]|uniref:hypothetical protein n=1 Tax=Lentibacillus populi TaxID=1827502 RepID=UPI00257027ED
SNEFDTECSNCEEEFEVIVEWNPSYYANKIEYVECEKCGTETRDICEKGRSFPYPEHYKETRVCKSCFLKGLEEQYEMEDKSCGKA